MKTRYLISSCLAIAAISACGKKNSDTDTESLTNALAEAYPSGLALAAFPQSTSTAALAFNADEAPEDKKPEDLTLKDKKELEKKVMEGKGDCMPPILKKEPPKIDPETCYEFDQDMIYSTRTQNGITKTLGTKDGKNAKGEACMVAFARTQIAEVADYVDRANSQIQAMMCQAKKGNADIKLPEPGAEALDLKAAMTDALGAKAAKLDSATIAAAADATTGVVTYTSTVKMTDDRGTARTIVLRHSPSASSTDENPAYSGVLSIRMKRGSKDGGQGASEKERFISVTYARSVENEKANLKYELRTAQFADALVEKVFTTEGVLNYNAGAEANGDFKINNQVVQPNEAVDSISYIAFAGNPETNEGTLSYWKNPGGNYNESARGMITEIKAGTDGSLSGCAISGAVLDASNQGISIRKSIVTGDVLKPGGFYHPFHTTNPQNGTTITGPTVEGTETFYNKVQTTPAETLKWYKPDAGDASTTFVTSQHGGYISKQCYKQSAAGLYEIDSTVTTKAAGFELVATTDTTKLFNPPALKGVKTDGKVEKKE